jgi:hypothetical protein
MTIEEIVKHYSELLVLQYRQKQKAIDTVKALVEPAVMDFLPAQVRDIFDIDTSGGVQLDIIGKYVGVVRDGFSSGKYILLNDEEFRKLIKLAIIKNLSHSDLKTIQELIATFFPNNLIVFDYLGMRMSYYFDRSVGRQDLVRLFISEELLPRPMGVALSSTVYSFDIFSFFGMGSYVIPARNVSPFNFYENYTFATPWLSYSYDARNDLNEPSSVLLENGDILVQENGDLIYL